MPRLTLSMPTELGRGPGRGEDVTGDGGYVTAEPASPSAQDPSAPAVLRWFACWASEAEC